MLKNKKIIITGGAGFLGKFLTKFLADKYKIITIDTKNIKKISKNHYHVKSNIIDYFKLIKLENIYAIIHLAGESRNNKYYIKPEKALDNIKNIYSILNSIAKSKKKPILIFTSSKQIDNDLKSNTIAPYSISKKFCEDLIIFYSKNYRFKVSILRLSDLFCKIYNPKNRALGQIINRAKENKRIFINNKNHTFEFVDIELVGKIVYSILKKRRKNFFLKIYGKKVNIKNLIKFITSEYNSKSKIKITNSKRSIVFKEKTFKWLTQFYSKNLFFSDLKKLIH